MSSMSSKSDMDETARLILMDNPKRGLVSFAQEMVKVHPELPLAGTTMYELYSKYMGWDGRKLPTHDFMTGKRLS